MYVFVFTLYLDLNDEANEEETCENCNLTRPKTQILLHIGQTKACKTHYGPRFKAMKALNDREQEQRSRAESDSTNLDAESKVLCEYCKKSFEPKKDTNNNQVYGDHLNLKLLR